MKVELLHFEGCPNAAAARELLLRCLAQLGIDASIEERSGDYPSPTICVDGEDVMGAPVAQGRACRLDLPTRARILAALRRASSFKP